MVQYKLYYFNIKGRGEFIRMMFVAAGQEFQDNRIESANWPQLKAQAPLGRMPFLEINDGQKVHKIGQSLSIARYLARKFNMYGKDEMDHVHADMYADEVADLVTAMGGAMYEKDEARKAVLMEKFTKEQLPTHMKLIDARLGANNGHLAGSDVTYADVIFYFQFIFFFLVIYLNVSFAFSSFSSRLWIK